MTSKFQMSLFSSMKNSLSLQLLPGHSLACSPSQKELNLGMTLYAQHLLMQRRAYALRQKTMKEPEPDRKFFLSQENNSELCRVTGFRAVSPVQKYEHTKVLSTKRKKSKRPLNSLSKFASFVKSSVPMSLEIQASRHCKDSVVSPKSTKFAQAKKTCDFLASSESEDKCKSLNATEIRNKQCFTFEDEARAFYHKKYEEKEVKKRVLSELAEVNKIPLSYFVFGKTALQYNLSMKLEDIAEMVSVGTNNDGEIVIKPKQIENSLTIKKLMGKTLNRNCEEYGSWKQAVTVTKVNLMGRSVTSCKNYSKPKKSTHGLSLGKILKRKVDVKESIPQSKIKLWHQSQNHLENHPINVTIKLINELSTALFHHKDGDMDRRRILNLCRKLGNGTTILTISQLNNADYLKSKENVCAIKEKLLKMLYATINHENNVVTGPTPGYSRFYIGGGNNPMLVKSVLKQRWWWTSTDVKEAANLAWTQWRKNNILPSLPCTHDRYDCTHEKIQMCNHVEGNVCLGNKKALFYNLKSYYLSLNQDPFAVMPLTFHVKTCNDPEYHQFVEIFNKAPFSTVWIVKPGENTNRGNGITVCQSLDEINNILNNIPSDHTIILQKYIERPLLYQRRKFDIRCFALVTAINGRVKGYFYKDGYIRTASKEFSLKNLGAQSVHLTNEAIQVKFDDFGKHEPGNKLTYADFQKYLDNHSEYRTLGINFERHIVSQIKKLVTDSIRAVHGKLDPKGRMHTFEIFGYDFMLDENFHLYLIEANINPCLEIISPITAKVVPAMLDSALRIAVDPIFQPNFQVGLAKKCGNEILPEIKHVLVYDSIKDGTELDELLKNKIEIEETDNDDVADYEEIEQQCKLLFMPSLLYALSITKLFEASFCKLFVCFPHFLRNPGFDL
eukprot:TRINITY_DN1388_c0_g1_i1.p1 TRINITY_DN1388_c0_g1~~TRINITY_DN1388_c0_g1_i1.p1  ORF type:complete len:898 (+),score=49.97 TRINITY_DN1388_c0_g1_i1:2615-5308(+)